MALLEDANNLQVVWDTPWPLQRGSLSEWISIVVDALLFLQCLFHFLMYHMSIQCCRATNCPRGTTTI